MVAKIATLRNSLRGAGRDRRIEACGVPSPVPCHVPRKSRVRQCSRRSFVAGAGACARALPFAAATFALALAGCGPAQNRAPAFGPTIDPSDPIRVALLTPSGSARRGDRIIAESLEKSALLAMSELQGAVIDLRVYDTAGRRDVAVARAIEAVDGGAQVILGPLHGDSAVAVAEAVRGANVNVLSFSNNGEIARDRENLYVLGHTFENTAARLARFAASVGVGRIFVVHGTDSGGMTGLQAIESAIANTPGAALASTLAHEPTREGIDAAAQELPFALVASGANSVFFTATTSGALPFLARQLPELGVSSERFRFIGLTRWDLPPRTLEIEGLQGGWFALPEPSRTAQFRERYTALHGGSPHGLGALSHDAIAAIGALAAAGRQDALASTGLTQRAGFAGADGVFRLLPDGGNQRGLAIAEVLDGQAIVIDPAPTRFFGAGF